MIVKVKSIPVRHNGSRNFAGDKFEISRTDYEKIQKFVDVVEEDSPEGDPQEPENIQNMTVPKLKEFAERENIDLGDVTKKEDILERIQSALDQRGYTA